MMTLDELFIQELERMYDAESRMIKMLSTTAMAATCWNLKKLILSHLLETEGHVMKLEQVFSCVEGHVTGKTCRATVGLAEQGAEIAEEFAGSPAINAALIAFLQKVEHQEIASYSSLLEWSLLLGHSDAAELLQEILDEEFAAVHAFRELARSTSNEEAFCRYGWGEMARPWDLNAAVG
jgi:ferritin-like metal-binding protein YciE